jgi:multiple sugar transport system substrate-binding protein
MKILTITLSVLISLSLYAEKKTITVGILAPNRIMREAYIDAKLKFEKENPGIAVKLIVKSIKHYNEQFPKWMAEKKGPDVLFWYAGEQLRSYVRQGAVASISLLWEKAKLDKSISENFKRLVTYKEQVYAIPFAYYGWGFIYRKSIFKKYDLQPPKTWPEFNKACQTLKNNNITPVSIGLKNKWPCLAWFDYLNLRINGLAYHLKLLKGQISYKDPGVKKVLTELKKLIDSATFCPDLITLDWKKALSQINNGVSGMTLIGLFAENELPEELKDDYQFFPFPQIQQTKIFENVPTDIFFMPSFAKNKPQALRFLQFISRAENMAILNRGTGSFSTNATKTSKLTPIKKQFKTLMQQANGFSQYFSRDSISEDISNTATDALTAFFLKPEIDRFTTILEKKRLELFTKAP